MELTPAQKRAKTLEAKYGPDWRKVVARLSHTKRDKGQYAAAGRRGGASVPDEHRPFKKDPGLAKSAGKKGANKRWGRDDAA